MPKWVKTIVAILLLPICIGTADAVWTAIRHAGARSQVWMPMLAGAACWTVIFLLLPKPMWVYIFGHELTHAVWTWAFGGSVKRFKARSTGGHVITTKNNFVIALAPYFFPFYAALIVVIFVVGDLLADWSRYIAWFYLLLGAAYAFHVTLTFEILKTRQTDITGQGWFFSAVIIFLGNALVLAFAVPLLAGRGLFQATAWWMQCNAGVFQRLSHFF